jgi:hypothetical protein
VFLFWKSVLWGVLAVAGELKFAGDLLGEATSAVLWDCASMLVGMRKTANFEQISISREGKIGLVSNGRQIRAATGSRPKWQVSESLLQDRWRLPQPCKSGIL